MRSRLRVLLLLVLFFPSGAAGRAEEISATLTITGTEGARFRGECTLATASGARTLQLEGVAPRSYTLAASGLTCRIRKEDRTSKLTIELRKAGTVVSRTSMTGGLGTATVVLQ